MVAQILYVSVCGPSTGLSITKSHKRFLVYLVGVLQKVI